MSKLATRLSLTLTLVLVGLIGYYVYVNGIELPNKDDTNINTEEIAQVTSSLNISLPEPPETKVELPQSVRITGISVSISAGGAMGSGAVISNNIVLTVQHVIGEQTMAMIDIGRYTNKWVPARVVGKLKATGEDVVVLQLIGKHKFDNGQHFRVGTGFRLPRWMVTPRGVYDFNPGVIVPGDSGGAILNIHGELIGLVTGYMHKDRRSVITLFR